MESRHDQLRDELVALLGAGRELTEETDRQLADAFMHFLEQRQAPAVPVAKPGRTAQAERPDQPHYSLMAAGGAWGAALMFLFLLLLLDQPGPVDFLLVTVLILSVVAALTRVPVHGPVRLAGAARNHHTAVGNTAESRLGKAHRRRA